MVRDLNLRMSSKLSNKGSEFYNRSIKSWLQDNYIEKIEYNPPELDLQTWLQYQKTSILIN